MLCSLGYIYRMWHELCKTQRLHGGHYQTNLIAWGNLMKMVAGDVQIISVLSLILLAMNIGFLVI